MEVSSRQAPLVGRTREFALLIERLTSARQGESGVILLGGEAGVGKTRLLTEVADHAAERGWRVLVGQAVDSEGMPPFLPFVEALREYVPTFSIEALTAQVGDAAEAEGQRYRLFDAVAEFIGSTARDEQSGLLLCLDDLQWADDSTLLLLEHLCRRLKNVPILILATYRDTDLDVTRPFARTLEQLIRQPASLRIDLKRLDVQGVRMMLEGLGRPEPPPALVDAIYQETDGNPFFVNEVFAYLAEEGRLFDAEGRWHLDLRVGPTEVPQSVRLVIGRRLERLSAECRAALGLAALLGRTFEFELLRSMSDVAEDTLLDAVEEAEAAHLVMSDERGRLSFGHELIRQTLLTSLTGPRRQRLHRRAAEAIERVHAAAVDAHLAEIAGHYRLAGGAADPTKHIEFSTSAGERALELRAYHEAARLFENAIAALQEQTSGNSRLVDLHSKCGRAYVSLAKWPDARRHLEAAAALLPDEITAERSALLIDLAVACRWDGDLSWSRRYAEEARALAERLNRLDLQAGATATMALVEFSEGDISRGSATYRNAIEVARDVDRSVAKTAHAGYAHLLYLSGRHNEAVERGLEGVNLARDLSDMATLTFALGPLGLSLAAAGRYAESDEAFAQARQIGSQYGIDGYLARAVSMSAAPHLDLFDFDGALQLADEASELAQRIDFAPAKVSTTIDRVLIHVRRGDVGRALEALPGVRASVMDVAHAMGTWLHGWLWNLRLAHIEAEVALARGEWREAVRLSTHSIELSRLRQRPKYEAGGLSVRGEALIALGRKREALADFNAAVRAARDTADPALFVRIAGTMLRVEPDDALCAEAQGCVTRILDAVADLRVRHAFEASETVQRIVAQRRYPDGLSEREVEVLRLIAMGKSNAQIAEELVISVNTVQRHVGNILSKTGLENRTQAASYAHRAGLLTD